MKKVLLLMFCALMGFALNAQVSENFSDYTVGGKLAQQAQAMGRDYWTTWSQAPGGVEDGIVDELAGDKVGHWTSGNDQVLLLGGKAAGVWNVSLKMYIPTGTCGYFNIVANFAGGSSTWAFQAYAGCLGESPNTLTPGVGTIHAAVSGGNAAGFNFLHDAWTDFRLYIDLDNDYAEFFVNDDLIYSWVYTAGTFGAGCPRVIDALNIYPPISVSDFYVDDIVFEQEAEPIVLYDTGFDDVAAGAYVAQSYPDWWTTWENQPGTIQDALITNEQSASPNNSAKCAGAPGDAGTDLVFKTGEPTTGTYMIDFDMYIPNGLPAYFNLLNNFVPSNPSACQWAIGVYLNVPAMNPLPAGTYVRNNGTIYNFTFPFDTWFPVSVSVDLDNDEASISIDGTHILTWTYSIDEEGDMAPRKLAAVDFFPIAANSIFYLDNFVYSMEDTGEHKPDIEVIPEEITETAEGEIITVPVVVINSGNSMGDYFSWITFDQEPPTGNQQFTLTYTLNDNQEDAVGYTDGECTVEAAAKYPLSYYCDMAGSYITKVAWYMYQSSADNKLIARVYGGGTYNTPGEILSETTISNPVVGMWNEITLTTPVLLDGQDIWVAFEMIQPAGGYLLSTGAGEAYENTNWTRRNGGGWGQMFTVGNPPQPAGIFMIKAFAEGGVFGCWASLTGDIYGTIPAGSSQTFDVHLDQTPLAQGVYEATLWVATNDEDHLLFEIPITFAVGISIDSRMDKILVDDEPATLTPGTTTYTITFETEEIDKVFIEAIPVSEDATVSGDIGDQDVVEGDNTFNIKVTAQDGVHFTDYVLIVTMKLPVAISEIDNTIKLFPNPVKDYLYITSDYTITIETITIYDLTGKVVKQVKQPGTSVNLNDLSAGYYLLKVTTEQGDAMHKFVKE